MFGLLQDFVLEVAGMDDLNTATGTTAVATTVVTTVTTTLTTVVATTVVIAVTATVSSINGTAIHHQYCTPKKLR